MLFVLIGGLLIASVLVLCVKKSQETFYLLGMCGSLLLQFSGILIFIAKKGGYSPELLDFLFFSMKFKSWAQYLYITLAQLGYLIALGRFLFPLFLLELAMSYSMLPALRRRPGLKWAACVLPAASLVCYWPAVFRLLTDRWPALQDILVQTAYFWVLAYTGLALVLLGIEYFSITMKFCRYQFSQIVIFQFALSMLYLLYCGQDPGQVYRFYSYDYIWNKGIGYLQYAPSVSGYVLIVVVNVICAVLGMASILRYTRGTFVNDRDEVVMERKFDIARTGASVFVHSIKNQLLANRVLEKRLYQELDKPEPDPAKLREGIDALHEANEMLISRSEELYRTVKSKRVQLVPVPLSALADATLERFYKKYPDGKAQADMSADIEVLADKNYLSEALYNLMINGWEANLAAGRPEETVSLISHAERLWTVLEVRDHGTGIPHAEQKKIYEPFYSSKNSNTNWGMGLYHVRTIVRSHLGSLRVESEPGKGTSFFVLLPRYGMTPAKAGKKEVGRDADPHSGR